MQHTISISSGLRTRALRCLRVLHRSLPSSYAHHSSRFSTSMSSASIDIPDDFRPKISEGHDAVSVRQDAAQLVSSKVRGTKHWHLNTTAQGLERVFRFKTFKATWEFMNEVAAKCKEQKHHPEWTNIYNKTHIIWTTHSPDGLSAKDTTMATFCDEAAAKLGEQEPSSEQQQEDERLFTKGKMEAPDCCTKRSL